MTFAPGQRVEYFQRSPRNMVDERGVVEKVHPNGGEDFVQYDVLFDNERIGLKLIHWTNLRALDEPLELLNGAPEKEDTDFEGKVIALFLEAAELLLSKHRDYGPLNIAHSPGGPVNGLRVRLHDKLARLNHLTDTSNDPEHESLEDTWRDIVGYGAIGLLVSRGDWPSE